MKELIDFIKEEFKSIEPNLTIDISRSEVPVKIMELETQKVFLKSIYSALNGVYRMSPDIPNLVETSNNIARVIVGNGKIHVASLTRSSSESSKNDLVNALTSCFELAGFNVELTGSYPGWQPNIDSEILKILTKLYENLFGKKAKVEACHAGLECGILGQNYPLMDMISFGPTIKGAHSPDERVSITSVQKFWKFLLQILKNIPC
jgi:dipeptidase D